MSKTSLLTDAEGEDFIAVPFTKEYLSLGHMSALQKYVYPTAYQESVDDLLRVWETQSVIGFAIQGPVSLEITDKQDLTSQCAAPTALLGYCIGFPIHPLGLLPVIQNPSALPPLWKALHATGLSVTDCPLFIYDCVIQPDCQGKGFGKKVVQALIREARVRGFPRIWAAAVDEDAGAFWKRLGFRRATDWNPAETAIQTDGPSQITALTDRTESWWTRLEAKKELPAIYQATNSFLMVFVL